MFKEMTYLSVSELNQQLKFHIEDAFFHCLVEGEVSNVIRAQSGHIYFNLKDATSVIRCVVWRMSAGGIQEFIQNGAKVEIQGELSLYVPRGDYQLVISRLAPLGRGNLYMQFEQLREKLQKEGLFNPEHKKKIPQYPCRIGIVTSPNAAALQDVLRTLKDHRPDIPYTIYPTLVQGEEAALQIAKAIHTANKEETCDLLLVVRGGGSIEDLWCFNDERVVRAIYASNIPVITGVGHEVDTTLADYVADLRAATPTAAAKLSSVSKYEVMQTLDSYAYQLKQLMQIQLNHAEKRLKERSMRLSYLHPLQKIKEKQNYLNQQKHRLLSCLQVQQAHKLTQLDYYKRRLSIELLKRKQHTLEEKLARSEQALRQQVMLKYTRMDDGLHQRILLLDSLSPLKVLSRGYSVTQQLKDGQLMPLTDLNNLQMGDQLSTKIGQGELISTVTEIVHK